MEGLKILLRTRKEKRLKGYTVHREEKTLPPVEKLGRELLVRNGELWTCLRTARQLLTPPPSLCQQGIHHLFISFFPLVDCNKNADRRVFEATKTSVETVEKKEEKKR